jgi:ADP-heptose:LPS heptosyltransferase/glycosyltransferase involved in cell wall biosynthesis
MSCVTSPKPKLLVVELWGLGDLVIATPFLQAASERFDLTLLAKPYAQDLRERLWPRVKVVPFVAPWTSFRRKYRLLSWPWREMLRLRRLAAERFQVGLSARWDPRDHFVLRALRTKRRLGFPRMGSQVLLTDSLVLPEATAHKYEQWRVLGRALGLELPPRQKIGLLSTRSNLGRGEVLVHTGAGQPVRVWPLDRYRKVVARLRRQNYQVRVACDPDQQTWWLGAGETSVATPRTVTELLGLLDGAAAFIGNDSGPGHLAAFTGVPTLTIFGPQLFECFAPLHPAAEWLEGQPCPHKPCSDYCHFAVPHCLWGLDEPTVWARVEKFVSEHAERTTEPVSPALSRVGGIDKVEDKAGDKGGDKGLDKRALTLRSSAYRSPKPRRFIQVFCRYLMRGGEETSVARISRHLELAGHEVLRFWRASSEWKAPGKPPAWRQLSMVWKNHQVLGQLAELNRQMKPDAWIFHNIIPVVSLGSYRLGLALNVPIIQWVHNYRPISPSGTMYAGGQMLRPDDPWLACKEIRSGAWRGRLPTAGLALAYARLRQRGDFEAVKAWIPVSEEMRQIFLRAGYPPDRFFCLHHSWDLQPPVALDLDEGYFLFLGRMVEEKGVRFLLELWQRPELAGLPLVMAGEGPLADEYRSQTPANIRWVGFVQGAEKRRLLAGCRALLFPCIWAEPLTTVVYEAYEQGKPVLASAMGGLKELVLENQTGRLLEAGNFTAWTQPILELARNPALSRQWGLRGLSWLQGEVSPDAWNRQFDEILARVLG